MIYIPDEYGNLTLPWDMDPLKLEKQVNELDRADLIWMVLKLCDEIRKVEES